MLNPRLMVSMLLLAVLMAFTPTLWAERDDRDDRSVQKPQRVQVPQRGEREGGRVEIKDRNQDQPREQRVPPGQPVRPPVPAREVRTAPEKSRPPVTARPVAPAPAPIKEWRTEAKVPKEPPRPGWVLDTKFKHNHYYPPRGHVVPVLPPAHRVIPHHNVHYYYHDGIWYRPHGTHFIVVLPPIGIFVPILPPFFTTIWVNSTTYYYAGGAYYAWRPAYQQYVVVEAPPEDQVRVSPNGGSDQLFIYPTMGQSEEQQARDRYECHRWAQSQTGYDPTLPGGGVPEAQHAAKRGDYTRAMKACLEARHYSVQ